ncbi:DoxX family protein [Mycobacterium sp.]|uniref:DoxX family protein n=1 Tax=Mycobacterium sp. TaxID=1785 RepID=UPI002DB38783|nr:hypothetical protein [Mycobacterium sp.]
MTSPPPEVQQIASPAPAYRLGAMLLGMGTLHFVAPKPFDAIVPDELPGSARSYTYGSGVAELASGVLSPASGRCPQLRRRTRRMGALAAVALFVAVFPANVNMVRLWKDKPWPMRVGAIVRLPLQIPMITTALKIFRDS